MGLVLVYSSLINKEASPLYNISSSVRYLLNTEVAVLTAVVMATATDSYFKNYPELACSPPLSPFPPPRRMFTRSVLYYMLIGRFVLQFYFWAAR